jgi:DNA alkylation repair enzyme
MPPIDLPRLRARTAALAERFADPSATATAVRQMLDDYADRSHRASPRVASRSLGYSFKVAPPVLRAIVTALRGPAQANPAAAMDMANQLWKNGSREERRIAAELLGQVALPQPAEALALIEAWAPRIEGSETADALAEYGLGPLMIADPARYLAEARRWVTFPQKWVRRFGLAALMPLVHDRQWDNVPSALSVVRLTMADIDGDVRRAAVAVLVGLAAKSPAEIGQFLREQASRTNTNTGSIIRGAMAALDPEEQTSIFKLLRA